ncbi:putative F-box domain, leucine-rich repeat domain superfamily, F-box-like domain superfamily [Helianthus annuus]|uniref:F-box domain, leucine-rich repeat domain superfamily, F-box-like domain superfamily n=1 Tax=Helianthus annuus TaxID=4232 RepID=A0A251VT24_HELAN|nr:putative F-box domain, leucine-rich repeat domain superfamily, F-box-like domain superfamily [Helianthus annuus]KAJ0597670.1 putative F-box domain, leucine-rich repeat domain superfamily, F-box-like domain superfamily [Helianthus annuus]KAJ0927674.1 putative F-box domain, leucine-rich repeat domain superfamily, F-box-like domain superfamily [Helianthus annuus]
MKVYKRTKRKNGVVDMISNLPDHILQLILSGLPTFEEAVRTSVLSTRWRYMWTSLPSLDLDCTRRLTNFKKNEFKEFVYWVLVNKTLDLDSFRLCCGSYYNMSTVGRWIHAAVMRKVKLLDLSFSPRVEDDEVIKLPHSLVTCDTLEVLRLYLYSCPLRLPAVTGFPALRVLELNSVELLNGDSVQQFLKNCPLLEDLSLVDCSLPSIDDLCISCLNLKTLKIDNRKMLDESYDGRYVCFYTYDRLQISCPKLVFLEYAGHPAYELSFEHLDSLKKAVIYPDATAHQELSFQSFGGTMCRLFEGVSHVESLSLNLYFIKVDIHMQYVRNNPLMWRYGLFCNITNMT